MKSAGRLFILLILFSWTMAHAEAAELKNPRVSELLNYLTFNNESLQKTSDVSETGTIGASRARILSGGVIGLRSWKPISVLNEVNQEVNPGNADETMKPDSSRFRIGLIFGFYLLNDKNLTDYYGHKGRFVPGVELSIHTFSNIDLWASFEIYADKRKTTFFGQTSKFKLNPLSIGLRYRPLIWKSVEPFVGAGLNLSPYSETISGESDLENTSNKAVGFHIQSGSYFHINRFRFLLGEVFLKYNFVKKTLAEMLPDGTDKLDLGGFEVGVGIVVKF